MTKRASMNNNTPSALEVARRVNWYTPPDEVTANPPLFIAQIMARGGAREITWMRRNFSIERQRSAYVSAPSGLFSRRCWAYWGLMLFDDPDAKPYPARFPDTPADQLPPWPGF